MVSISPSSPTIVMKRTLASLISIITLLIIASPALASPNLTTRNSQPRIDIRALKKATLANYRTRQKFSTEALNLARQRYSAMVQTVMRSYPTQLTVTGGGRTHSDLLINNRPSPRSIQDWRLTDHCRMNSRKCEDRNS